MFEKGRERAQDAAHPIPLDADRPAVEAARRDPRRFELLYRKYVAQVYSYALYETRDQHAAEDLTEQVFLRALRGLPGFHERGEGPDSTFRVWLFRIARNALLNERRRGRRHPDVPLDVAWELAGPEDPQQVVEQRDQARRAWSAIARLPAERRRALVLRFVEEMSIGEIGAVLGRTDGSVRVLIHRALRSVAAQLAADDARTEREEAVDAGRFAGQGPAASVPAPHRRWRR